MLCTTRKQSNFTLYTIRLLQMGNCKWAMSQFDPEETARHRKQWHEPELKQNPRTSLNLSKLSAWPAEAGQGKRSKRGQPRLQWR